MRTLLCVWPPRVQSLFPPVLSKSCNQFPLGFKVWFSRNSSSHCQTPRFGSLTWGSEPSLQWVDFCGISVLQSVSHPPTSYGIWFYCDCTPPTVSLWLLLCLWMWVSFLVSSSVFLSMIVQQLVVILVFSQEGVRACPSTPPSWFLSQLSVLYIAVSICQSQSPNLSFPHLPPLVNISFFSISVTLFCFVNSFICTIFLYSMYKWYHMIFVFLWLIHLVWQSLGPSMSLQTIHVTEKGIISFFFMAE